jgi:hypothetical protein
MAMQRRAGMLSIIKHEDENTRMMTRRIILQGENSSF